jgi:plasmid rolling circle replication initiator protein Rep
MTDRPPDHRFTSSLSHSLDLSDNAEAPLLSDLSPKDKPWDKHRGNADKIANYYRGSDFDQYAQRIDTCSQLLDFRLVPDDSEGEHKLKLSSARFCRVRHCPVCQWRRSLMWKAKAYKTLPRVVAAFPKHRWLFLTLTLKNCKISELRSTLNFVNKAFKRLTDLKAWPAEGWIKSVEVTRGKNGSAHPHIHCLLMVSSSYCSGRYYISQSKWVDMWEKCLRVDYKPVLDVRAIKPHHSPVVLIPEILKYQTKVSDLVADREWFLEYQQQLHKTKAITVGGVLREYFRELEEEPQDLIGEDEKGEGELDEGHLYFGWKRRVKKYKLVAGQLS